tara:strand:- start:1000 stop:1476 length:477 start_codon:yes stop_codon:yes gene_type:complete
MSGRRKMAPWRHELPEEYFVVFEHTEHSTDYRVVETVEDPETEVDFEIASRIKNTFKPGRTKTVKVWDPVVMYSLHGKERKIIGETVARLYLHSDKENALGIGYAYWSADHAPNYRIFRAVAKGRAEKNAVEMVREGVLAAHKVDWEASLPTEATITV